MAAPKDELPGGIGAPRAAWLEAVYRDLTKINADPQHRSYDFAAGRDAGTKAMFKACSERLDRACRAAFDAVPAVETWPESDRLLLDRYRELIARPVWREVVPRDFRAPIAAYQNEIAGLRLQMLALRGADAATLNGALAQDARYWRRRLASSDTLISKMIATAGLRQHFWFGNLLLRRISAARALDAIPDEWRDELTRPELALERSMAGELVMQESIVRAPGEVDIFDEEPELEPARTEGRTFRRLRQIAVRPFYQPQDVMNHLAAEYLAAEQAFEVPLAQYPVVARGWSLRRRVDAFPSRVYDATGDYVRELFRIDFSQYRSRVASLEGARRAALVTTELRARGIPATLADMPGELARSPLQDPFGAGFSWSPEDQAMVYIGPETHRWRRLEFDY
jgi:hypothetical protein